MNMSDIDISEPLSDMLAPLNNEQKEFLMNNYTIQTYKKNRTNSTVKEKRHIIWCVSSVEKWKSSKMVWGVEVKLSAWLNPPNTLDIVPTSQKRIM